jgi:excisionase family DNA binding protein
MDMEEKTDNHQIEEWLDLSEAAQKIGVHFTTLRRWADQGKIAHIRTPGGRRRFSLQEIHSFLNDIHSSDKPEEIVVGEIADHSLLQTREALRHLSEHHGGWVSHMDSDQRSLFRSQGQKMLGLLLQYAACHGEGKPFLDEARSIGHTYGEVCRRNGMGAGQIIEAYMVFQRSILESIMITTENHSANVLESQRLFQRSSKFLEEVLISSIEGF